MERKSLEQWQDEISIQYGYESFKEVSNESYQPVHMDICYEALKLFSSQEIALMQGKIDRLNEMIKSDSVYRLLRFGYKSPSSSGVDECQDNLYEDLYQYSVNLRHNLVSPHKPTQ